MASQGENGWNRREFLRGPTLAGTALILGLKSESSAAEPPLETTRIRIADAPVTCFAPIYIAEGLLKAEGFTDVQYIKMPLNQGTTKALAEGKARSEERRVGKEWRTRRLLRRGRGKRRS